MSDIVERLNLHGSWRDSHGELNDAPSIAAAEITRLRDEVERLREAAMAIVGAVRAYLPPDGISKEDFIDQVIVATDNPKITPVIEAIENS